MEGNRERVCLREAKEYYQRLQGGLRQGEVGENVRACLQYVLRAYQVHFAIGEPRLELLLQIEQVRRAKGLSVMVVEYMFLIERLGRATALDGYTEWELICLLEKCLAEIFRAMQIENPLV